MSSLAVNQGVSELTYRHDSLAENGLIEAAKLGDLEAFNCLVLLYQDSLYWWVYSLVHDEAQADDIAQSTFITAYQKLQIFRGGSFKSWLFTIARNRSFDQLRQMKRRPSVRLDDPAEDDRDRLELLPDVASLPEETLLAAEQAKLVEQMIHRLPDAFQQVIRLIDMEGLDYQDAAKILNLPLGTIKSRLTRARQKMRSLFELSGQL